MAKKVLPSIGRPVTGAEYLKVPCFGHQAVTRQGRLDKGRAVG